MRLKRGLFVGSLILLFVVCFTIMNKHSDELARYKYATKENSEMILEALSTDEINYLIDRQFTPEEFMPYLNYNGFNIRYVNYYNTCKQIRNADSQILIDFVNLYFEKGYHSDDLADYVTNYEYKSLNQFMNDGDFYNKTSLVSHVHDHLVLENNQTLYTYKPDHLVEVENVPNVNQNSNESLYLRADTYDALSKLCEAATKETGKTCGNMIMVQGYVDVNQQEEIYEEAILRYGQDDALKYVDLPGRNLAQLGNQVKLVIARADLEQLESDEMPEIQIWMLENASKYGFMIENDTKKAVDHFKLRYVNTGEEK